MLPPSFASWLTPTVRPKLGKQAVNEAQAADGALCDLCGNDRVSFRSYEELRRRWPKIEDAARRSEPEEREATTRGGQ
jgi:hypothetical protein